MDTSRSNLYQEDVTELLSMLELSDIQTVNGVKALIHENLNGTKDILLLQGLVNYYIACQSEHALEILVKVRDPHDKHLFDKIAEYMKDENMRYQCLVLLSHIVHSQPPWLHKISNHRIFQTLLALLKSEKDSPSLLCALFIIVCLLPMIPSQIGPYLNDIFDVFSRLTSWSVKNSIGVPEIYVLHLQVGVYALFHRLYGMYPCNFLGYLRSYYGRKEYREDNLGVFVNAIKPMLQRVKLHPLLVTSCKETEVNFKRWRKMAPHDIIVECASVSLDAIEGGCEDVYVKNTSCNSGFSENMHPFSNENSSHHVSFSSQNSAVLTVDPNSLVSESMNVKQDVICSPSLVCDVDTPAQMLYAASELDDSAKKLLDRLPQNKVDSELQVNSVDEKSIELADKEVSELTSSTPNPNVQERFEVRHDTPFCSTTQNLTDNPEIPDIKPIDLLKDKDEEEQTNVSQEPSGIETLVQKINRFRYLSHCGMLPELSNERSDRPIVVRSISCPDIFNEQTLSNSVMSKSATMKVDMSPTFSPDVPASCPSTMHSSTPCSSPHVVDTQYSHLIPMIVQPISQVEDRDGGEKSTSNTHITSPSCNFTPAELLDRHILLSNEIYISQLNSIPLTSTKNVNWTHFGGKPPADEVAMLQTQIMLLHNQLMFERHRCEIHRERNRRLLGKARRTRMQEEYTTALKDQVSLLEKENHKLQQQVAEVHELYRTMYQEKNLSDNNADSTIKKLAQDKNTLQYSIKTLQGLLVAQKQDMDAISNTCKLDKPKIVDLELEIEMLRRDKATLVKGEKEFLQLSNQNALLQNLNELYLQRLEAAKEPIIENDTIDLIRDAAAAEIKALKEILEAKSLQVDICLKKINELEKEASSLKLKVIEQIQITENMEALHKDEIAARDDRLFDLKKIIHQTESHVLQLYNVQDQLNDKIKVLSSKPKVPSVAGCSGDTSNTPMSDEHTFTCDEGNIQNLLAPEQENIQETSELE